MIHKGKRATAVPRRRLKFTRVVFQGILACSDENFAHPHPWAVGRSEAFQGHSFIYPAHAGKLIATNPKISKAVEPRAKAL
jgi:hypothetical protein